MFTVTCPRHGSEVLLSTRSIERLANTDAGVELHWRCSCGHRGVLATGRAAARTRAADAVPTEPAESADAARAEVA